MLSFWDWAGGPVVGSHYNDAILQTAIRSKYGAVEAKPEDHKSLANCRFLGMGCKNIGMKKKEKRRTNG